MRPPSHLPSPRWLLLIICLCPWLFRPLGARQPGSPGGKDDQFRATIEEADKIAHPTSTGEARNLQRREDLEQAFAKIVGNAADGVYFYYGGDSDAAAANADSIWALSLESSAPLSYGLYMFDSTEGFAESSEEFSRLMSHLKVSISDEEAADLARFFLTCCVRGAPAEIAEDDDSLQHAVERYYLQAYGDVSRALEANMEWEQSYRQITARPAPAAKVENGARQIVLDRLVLRFGMHPQLERWTIDVSRHGMVRVLDAAPVFPKQSRWLSYDFRASVPLAKDEPVFSLP